MKGSGMKLVVQNGKRLAEPQSFDNQFIDEPQQQQRYGQKGQSSEDVNIKKDEQNIYNHSIAFNYPQTNQALHESLLLQTNHNNSFQKLVVLAKNKGEEDKQGKIINKINKGMSKLQKSILQMKEKYDDLGFQQLMFKRRDKKKQKQIKQFLDLIKSQQVKRSKKVKKAMDRDAKSLQQIRRLEEQQEKNKPRLLAQEHLKKIRQVKQMRSKSDKQQQKQNKKIEEMYAQIKAHEKQHPKYHIKKLQQEKKINAERIESQKAYLMKRKQNFKPLDMQQLESHKKRHEQLLQQLEQLKNVQKEEEYLKILQQNKKIEEIYRGKTYDFVLNQIQERKIKKKQVHDRNKALQDYKEYVRQNFIPKSVSKQKQGIQDEEIMKNHSSMSHREVRKYRYQSTLSFGELVVESLPLPVTGVEQRKMGNQYMAYMRSLPKKRKQQIETHQSQNNQTIEMKLLKQKKPNPLASRQYLSKKSSEVKISDTPTRDELNFAIIKLKNKDKQINMKEKVMRIQQLGGDSKRLKQNQIDSQFILNMEKKLNLLTKMKKPQKT